MVACRLAICSNAESPTGLPGTTRHPSIQCPRAWASGLAQSICRQHHFSGIDPLRLHPLSDARATKSGNAPRLLAFLNIQRWKYSPALPINLPTPVAAYRVMRGVTGLKVLGNRRHSRLLLTRA